MKLNKITTIVLSLLLVALVTVAATVAYLVDTDTNKNTFTVGNIDIVLNETDVDTDGVPIPGADRVDSNEYHLLPGKSYVKDPMVTLNPNSEECFVRVLVTFNCKAELDSAFGGSFAPEKLISGWDANIWALAGSKDNGDGTVTYEYRYRKTVSTMGATDALSLEPVFTEIVVPGEISGEALSKLGGFEITVVANAIQAVGFNGDANAAWTAFEGISD